nr:reverse transcriptase domain-containing protein [Tanacetum cinerariifolium]
MDEDLKKPFKEARRTSLTRRIIEFAGPEYKMPTNIKLYDGTTDPEDHLSPFAGATNSGEWLMPVRCRMFQKTLDGSTRGWFERLPRDSINEWADLREAFTARYSVRRACFKKLHEITKIFRKANESSTAFKERWTMETGFIMDVSEVMKISSFMDAVKSPELVKHFSNKESPGILIAEHSSHSIGGTIDRSGTLIKEIHEGMITETVTKEEMHILQTEQETTGTHTPRRGESITIGSSRTHARHSDQAPEGNFSYQNAATPSKSPSHVEPIEETVGNGVRIREVKSPNEGRSTTRKRSQGRNPPQPAKIINVISVSSVNDKKGKVREITKSWMNIPISFPTISSNDTSEEPLIVEAEVEGYVVRRVYVDEGSLVEVMFEHCFKNIDSRIKARLKETQTDLVGFAGKISKLLGKIELKVCFDSGGLSRRTSMKFTVVRAPSPYNIILGRPRLKILRAIPFIIHSMMKFPTPKGVATLVTRTVI